MLGKGFEIGITKEHQWSQSLPHPRQGRTGPPRLSSGMIRRRHDQTYPTVCVGDDGIDRRRSKAYVAAPINAWAITHG